MTKVDLKRDELLGDIFSKEEFMDCVLSTGIVNDDGSGFYGLVYSDRGRRVVVETSIKAIPSEIGSHGWNDMFDVVFWYNK